TLGDAGEAGVSGSRRPPLGRRPPRRASEAPLPRPSAPRITTRPLLAPRPRRPPLSDPSALNRYACLVEPGRVELRSAPVPRPGPGEVLLRVERALAGGTDRKAFARGHPQIPMPGPFGHRYAGTVADLGPGAPD